MAAYLKEFWTDKRILFLSFALIAYCATVLLTPHHAWTWLAVSAGILFFFFLEYFTHRFILHGFFARFMKKAFQGHVDHHNDPDNLVYMLTPNSYNVPLHVLFIAFFSLLTQSIHLGAAVMLGTTLYQLYYEWTHLVSHRPIVPATNIGKNRKKRHLLHHYKSDRHWFGVTNVTFDNMAGTNPPSSHVPMPSENSNSGSISI